MLNDLHVTTSDNCLLLVTYINRAPPTDTEFDWQPKLTIILSVFVSLWLW